MTRFQHVVIALYAIMAAFAFPRSAAADLHPMSVDDMMRVEGLGMAASDPTGHWLVYERLRPYDQSDDYSFRTYATMGKSGHQLWWYDLKKKGIPKLLPGVDPAPSSYLEGFSPSGRFLSIMQYRLGILSIGAYDLPHERFVRFKDLPAFSRAGEYNPVWVSNDELVFTALPAGQLLTSTSIRVYTGRGLAKAWEDAWRGKVVTASEVDSPSTSEDQSGQQEPGQLVRVDARTGKTTILARGLYADLRVSPDRRFIAALTVSKPRPVDPNKPSVDDPRRYRLAVFNLKSRERKPLAPGLEFFPYTIAWASDSKRIAVYGWAPNQSPHDGRFYVIDVETGKVVRYDHVGLDLASERERGFLERPERVAFMGDSLAVFARRIPDKEDQTPRFTYQGIRPVGLSNPDWYALHLDGTSKNLTQGLDGISGVPVYVGDDHLTVVANNGVYRLDADGHRYRLTPPLSGQFEYLAPGTFATRAGVLRPDFKDEAVALFNVQGVGSTKIAMVDLRSGREGKSMVVTAPSANATPIAGSMAAGVLLFRAEDGVVSRLLVARASEPDSFHEIARINARLANVDFGTWKVVSYKVTDPEGKQSPETLESCVLLPPGSKPGIILPLVVEVYPDARPDCKEGGIMTDYWPDPHSPYLWAGMGYAYARLATPGALIRTKDGPIAGMPHVVEDGVAALVAQGIADPKRVALEGVSQGGVSALYVAAHTKIFKAVIAMNSWFDLFSHYFDGNGIYSYFSGEYFGNFSRYDSVVGSAFGIGKTPFQNPQIYYRNSPVFLAPRVNAPVLLVSADMDEFSMSQMDEMYGSLLRAGKNVRYVRYWGEGHAPSSPANLRDLWARKARFLHENGVQPYAETQKPPDRVVVPAT